MNRLNFSLPEFTRIVWASDKAKELWKPRIDAINAAWPRIERATVSSQMRLGGLQNVSPDGLLQLQEWCFDNDLYYSVLVREGTSGTYSNASHPVKPGKPWVYRVYFGLAPKDFTSRWYDGDDKAIGEFLGYPPCCTEFFRLHWKEGGWRDLTPHMLRKNGGPYQCNILLRHLGVRPVFHLPCSFNCEKTVRLANNILSYRSMGYEKEIAWLIEILNWPVKWSSLHGVAITTTPVVKVISSTDALAEKEEIERDGNYPEAGVSGNEFTTPRMMNLVMEDRWSDNGFGSYHAMKRAHKLIINLLYKVPVQGGNVIDLGCGNGALLERIFDEFALVPYGIESDPTRASHAHLEKVWVGNIFNPSHYDKLDYSFALVSLNRFFEVGPLATKLFLESLKPHVQYLVVYAYEPWRADLDKVIGHSFRPLHSELDGSSEARIFRPNEN